MNNSIRDKILSPLFATFVCLSPVAGRADYVEPEVKNQVNKQTDLFEKSIQDLPNFTKKLEEVKQDGIKSLGEKGGTSEGLKFITEKSKAELEAEGKKFESIQENDLAERGRKEMIESNNLNELYPKYKRSLKKKHRKDAKTIASKHRELMDNILGELKDKLGVDCKTIKGDKRIEPEYFLQINKTETKDTVYNQTFCEELRNKYSCNDTVTLKCQRTGKAYGQWQDRRIRFNGHTLHWEKMNWGYALHWKRKRWGWHIHSHHPRGFFFSPSESPWRNNPAAIIADARSYIANHLQVPIEQIGEHVEFPAAGRGIGNIGGVGCRWRVVWDEYEFGYKYRDSYDICEQWSEDWNETCRLQ